MALVNIQLTIMQLWLGMQRTKEPNIIWNKIYTHHILETFFNSFLRKTLQKPEVNPIFPESHEYCSYDVIISYKLVKTVEGVSQGCFHDGESTAVEGILA